MELTLEDYMREKLSREMSASIDFDILCDTLVPFGWTAVKVEHDGIQKWADIIEWVSANITGEYKEHKGRWLFKNTQDAIMFKLRWA